jgi:putative acetyltransferase
LSNPEIFRTSPASEDYRGLVKLLDADLKIRDGEDHAFFAQYNKSDTIQHVVIARANNVAVACGAFKPYADHTAEIKRMFVLPEYRGQGIAQQVLRELESWAAEEGFNLCILETGVKQPEAIRLYQKSGYEVIPNYGQYKDVASSVCMQRKIAG